MEVAAMVQRTNRNQMRSKYHKVGSTTDNSSGQAPPPVPNNGQASKPTGSSSRKPKGMNWDKINAKAKEKRAESRMIVDYEEVCCLSKFPDLTSFSITTKDADESNGSDGSDSDGSDSEGNSDDNNGNNDSDDGDLNGGNGRDRRKEKSGSVFESEEAFERMMKRAIEKAVFALQVKKKPKHGNNERVARKKATQKEKIQEDKSERAQFCVSNI